jgi:glutaredoxin
MTTLTATEPTSRPSRRQRLLAAAGQDTVVVFRSPLTDTRTLIDWLRRHGVPHTEVTLSMASWEERERFQELRALTGWETLPQVFVRGELVGGERELYRRYPAGIPVDSAALRQSTRSERASRWLGYGGVAPFALGLAAVLFAEPGVVQDRVIELTLAYGAVILSFLGAVHWGRLLERGALDHNPAQAAWGVLPSILGWLSLALPPPVAVLVQMVLFVEVYLVDRWLLRGEPGAGAYLSLRGRLTGLVASLLLGTWVAGAVG